MSITRQNVSVYNDRAAKYTFTSDQLHKEYIIETRMRDGDEACAEPLFVHWRTWDLCGVGPFTAGRITCDPMPASGVGAEMAGLAGLEPPSDRGVGLEFEFVARELTEEMVSRIATTSSIYMGLTEYTYQTVPEEAKVSALEACFNSSASGPGGNCSDTSHCALTQYCRADGVCDSRSNCRDAADAAEGVCPVPPSLWSWVQDVSVEPLTWYEARSIGDTRESIGIGFEVKSPPPPHVLSGARGLKSALEVLALLRHIGIQAGPSQGMHVHVNVVNGDAPGVQLSPIQIAAVWAAYAKFQLVIDEMLSPTRPGNFYAARLFLGNCRVAGVRANCLEDPCSCVRRTFYQMHQWFRARRTGSSLEFCNAALGMPGTPAPCDPETQEPFQRYMQLNLVPLHKYGTIEFRAHSATYDPVRVARWVQFVVAFVEHYGRGPGFGRMEPFFAGGSPDGAYLALQKAQREAGAAELFGDLRGLTGSGAAEYFGSRAWEEADPMCHPRHPKPTRQRSACTFPRPRGTGHDDKELHFMLGLPY